MPRKSSSRVTPCGFKHGLTPLSIGMAAAEFLPADPTVWIEAASRAGIMIKKEDGRLVMCWESATSDEKNFLLGWLHGTLGGEEAIKEFLCLRRSAA